MNMYLRNQAEEMLPRASQNLFKNKYRITSSRLKGWDYSGPGYYFVTICVKNKQHVFGDIVSCKEEPGACIHLSASGLFVQKIWEEIPIWYSNASLDCIQIMPDHLHCILAIDERREKVTLGLIMNQWKAECTKAIRRSSCTDFVWQSRFHDHIVRNEKDLERIRKYIFDNPTKWLAEHGTD